LHGPAGVGVRSLVHQWYSQQGERFPDGALRVPLGDAVAGDEPLVAEALADVLAECMAVLRTCWSTGLVSSPGPGPDSHTLVSRSRAHADRKSA
jgi:hypothetical protein